MTDLHTSERDKNVANRGAITAVLMIGTFMVVLDTTIANVALPHMQGALSASQEQITWVLSSYIIATAVMTPVTGWLSSRFGAKNFLIAATLGFTVSSALCGMATSLPELVVFRIMQGLSGAALIPLTQVIMFDIYPPEQHAKAMSIWGVGTMVAPILGPIVGGWLTEHASWRWVFYINIPIGALCIAGVWSFLAGAASSTTRRFDVWGFIALACAVGSLQLLLDRGESVGWFESPEIWAELCVAVIGFYLFILQSLTADHPFFARSLFANKSLVISTGMAMLVSMLAFSVYALQPILVQRLLGYPVTDAGFISAPRGAASIVAMFATPWIVKKLGASLTCAVGLVGGGLSLMMMQGYSLDMDANALVASNIVNGLFMPLTFTPLSIMALGGLENPSQRADAASLFNLFRNFGSSAGIAIVSSLQVRTAAAAHSHMLEHVSPDNPVARAAGPDFFESLQGMNMLDQMIERQAQMVSYVNVFATLAIVSFILAPLVYLARPRNKPTELGTIEHVID